jgi:hypothetical protein
MLTTVSDLLDALHLVLEWKEGFLTIPPKTLRKMHLEVHPHSPAIMMDSNLRFYEVAKVPFEAVASIDSMNRDIYVPLSIMNYDDILELPLPCETNKRNLTKLKFWLDKCEKAYRTPAPIWCQGRIPCDVDGRKHTNQYQHPFHKSIVLCGTCWEASTCEDCLTAIKDCAECPCSKQVHPCGFCKHQYIC